MVLRGPGSGDEGPPVVACPEPGCVAPAGVMHRFVLASTHGPAEHVQTLCLHGHVRTPLVTPDSVCRDPAPPHVSQQPGYQQVWR